MLGHNVREGQARHSPAASRGMPGARQLHNGAVQGDGGEVPEDEGGDTGRDQENAQGARRMAVSMSKPTASMAAPMAP